MSCHCATTYIQSDDLSAKPSTSFKADATAVKESEETDRRASSVPPCWGLTTMLGPLGPRQNAIQGDGPPSGASRPTTRETTLLTGPFDRILALATVGGPPSPRLQAPAIVLGTRKEARGVRAKSVTDHAVAMVGLRAAGEYARNAVSP